MSTDVKLPIDQVPVFPECCVACRGTTDVEPRTVPLRSASLWNLFLGMPIHRRRPVSVVIPICMSCEPAFRSRRKWFYRIMAPVIMLIAFAYCVVMYTRPASVAELIDLKLVSHFKVLLILLVATVPFGVWWVFTAPPFDLVALRRHIVYEFMDPSLASEFVRLNDGAKEL